MFGERKTTNFPPYESEHQLVQEAFKLIYHRHKKNTEDWIKNVKTFLLFLKAFSCADSSSVHRFVARQPAARESRSVGVDKDAKLPSCLEL